MNGLNRLANSLPFRLAVALAWMGVIFFLSAQSKLPQFTPGAPKLQEIGGHFSAYVVLALLWQWALRGAGVRRAGLWAVLLAVLYGMSDEYHQSFVPGRSMQFSDLVVDTIGASLAAIIAARAPWLRAARQATDTTQRPGPGSQRVR